MPVEGHFALKTSSHVEAASRKQFRRPFVFRDLCYHCYYLQVESTWFGLDERKLEEVGQHILLVQYEIIFTLVEIPAGICHQKEGFVVGHTKHD